MENKNNGKEYEKYITGSFCYFTDIKHNPIHQLYFNKIKKKISMSLKINPANF